MAKKLNLLPGEMWVYPEAATLDITSCDLKTDDVHDHMDADAAAILADGVVTPAEFAHYVEHSRQAHALTHRTLDMERPLNRAYEAVRTGHIEQVPAILKATQL